MVSVLALAAGGVGATLFGVALLVFIFCLVRSCCCFRLQRGRQRAQVFHSAPLELYFCPAPSRASFDSQRVHCALLEKGAECKLHDVDASTLDGGYDHLKEDILQVNPNGNLPFIVHEGHPVLGNLREILEYIDQHLEGPKLIPPEEKGVAEMANVINLSLTELSPNVKKLAEPVSYGLAKWKDKVRPFLKLHRWPNPLPEFWRLASCLWGSGSRLPKATAIGALRKVTGALQALDKRLGDGRAWLAGEFTLADVIVAADLNLLEVLGLLQLLAVDQGSCPNLMAYWKRVQARPSFGRSFRPNADTPTKLAFERGYARFRKDLAEGGLVLAYGLEEDEEEEESR